MQIIFIYLNANIFYLKKAWLNQISIQVVYELE